MKKFIITLVLIVVIVNSANSQCINSKESFIHKISLGIGIGAQILAQKYSPFISNSSLLGNIVIQYQINNNLSTNLNTAFKEKAGIELSYTTIGAKYSYLSYKRTMFPYIEFNLGAYFSEIIPSVREDTFTIEEPLHTSVRETFFGGCLGTGFDLKLSTLSILDINVKLHSFELGSNNSTYFITVLSNLRINL